MAKKHFLIVILATIFAMVCLQGAAFAGKDNLIVAMSAKPQNLDFYQSAARTDIQIGYLIYDALFERDPKTAKLTPHLVTDYKLVNPTTWEFTLRSGIKFHSGNPLNAECIRFTIDRVLDPALKSVQAANWKWIKKVEVVDDLTFRLHTDGPYPIALERLNTLFPYDPIWVKEMVAKHGQVYLSRHMNGTGPFKFAKYVEGDRLELVRNEDYWMDGWPKFKKMTVRFVPEQSTRLAEVLGGGVDVAQWLLPDAIPTLQKSKRVKAIEVPILRVSFWQLDGDGRAGERSKPLMDIRVRKAIWHAVDREAIIKDVLGGHVDLVNIPNNPIVLAADPSIEIPEYNPEKAKALLKEAGYENGFELDIWTWSSMYLQYMEAAMPYLEKVGIKPVLKDYAGRWPDLAPLLKGGKVSGVLHSSWGSFNVYDPDAIYSYFFMSPEGPYVYNKDPELNKWLHKARQTMDEKVRKELYTKAQKRVIEQAYWIPLFTEHSIHGANKKVNYVLGHDQVPRFKYASWID
jgi:peptide/nickel transport system substrate-binding protein